MNYKKLKLFLLLSQVFVAIGIIFWILAGCANWFSETGKCLGMSENHLFFDALLSFLLAIWFLFFGFLFHYLKHEEFNGILDSSINFINKVLDIFFISRRKNKKVQINIDS